MKREIENLPGNVDGIAYSFTVLRFDGAGAEAPSAYIQAALHGDELPGVVAIHALMPKLLRAETQGRIRGKITIVPQANPIGQTQYLFGSRQGRFHLASRTNFNRDFPLLGAPDMAPPSSTDLTIPVDQRLKSRLIELSMGHDIVLDLHCDDEGTPYLYVPKALWPAMSDCAAAMNMAAVVLWDGSSGASFDEASLHPYLQTGDFANRIVTTVEYRGVNDVDAETAEHDAAGIYRILVARGVIVDGELPPLPAYSGIEAPIENIEIVRSPCPGAVFLHAQPGDRVKAGDALATIVHSPGEPDGETIVAAPQSGFILTRLAARYTESGGDLYKLIGERPSETHREGALEV